MVEVTQEDWALAVELCQAFSGSDLDLRAINHKLSGNDDYAPVQIIARHRTAADERVKALEAKVVEQAEELLWEAYRSGSERPDGRWTHMFMSDGEWLARQCGFDPCLPDYDADAIKAAIPDAARRALGEG